MSRLPLILISQDSKQGYNMNLSQSITYLFPDAKVQRDFRIAVEDGVQRIEYWGINAPEPTEVELDAAWVEVQKLAYRVQRAEAYPPIVEQIEAIMKGGDYFTEMQNRIMAVKKEFPKS